MQALDLNNPTWIQQNSGYTCYMHVCWPTWNLQRYLSLFAKTHIHFVYSQIKIKIKGRANIQMTHTQKGRTQPAAILKLFSQGPPLSPPPNIFNSKCLMLLGHPNRAEVTEGGMNGWISMSTPVIQSLILTTFMIASKQNQNILRCLLCSLHVQLATDHYSGPRTAMQDRNRGNQGYEVYLRV